MMLLTTKMRTLLEKMVRSGVPPMAAGMSMGMSAKTIGQWMNCGMGFVDCAPEKPARPEASMECDGATITEGAWYKHEIECAHLARAVVATEGKLVSGLVKRMWKSSGRNPDMMKFLFKQYTHAHGLKEEKPSKDEADVKPGGSEDAVQIIMPDNGRMLVRSGK